MLQVGFNGKTINLYLYHFLVHVNDWIRMLKRSKEDKKVEPVPPKVEPDKFESALKETDKMTSSSPSGLHYTLWKAIAEKSLL